MNPGTRKTGRASGRRAGRRNSGSAVSRASSHPQRSSPCRGTSTASPTTSGEGMQVSLRDPTRGLRPQPAGDQGAEASRIVQTTASVAWDDRYDLNAAPYLVGVPL